MKTIVGCLGLVIGLAVADPIVDEALLGATKSAGSKVYWACIVTPPVTEVQKGICAGLYGTYMASLTALNAPLPIVLSIDPDPYVWSPYDICRYETGHIVFGDQGIQPYCPSI